VILRFTGPLGQLAYDKGMRILAASQAEDVAVEIQSLHHGLLTYALVQGLGLGDAGQLAADLNGDGVVTLAEWLKYAEQRTPTFYAQASKVRDSDPNKAFGKTRSNETPTVQRPALFDFHNQADEVVLQRVAK
jgi:hypothetical protein